MNHTTPNMATRLTRTMLPNMLKLACSVHDTLTVSPPHQTGGALQSKCLQLPRRTERCGSSLQPPPPPDPNHALPEAPCHSMLQNSKLECTAWTTPLQNHFLKSYCAISGWLTAKQCFIATVIITCFTSQRLWLMLILAFFTGISCFLLDQLSSCSLM